ncbi:MAG TPA: hypothetical protein VMC62_12055 [Longilinea sp.]|nr:hypothetical protein [Longilinea sp.]
MKFVRRFGVFWGQAWEALFSGRPDVRFRWVGWTTIVILYLVGIEFWGAFFQWGNFSYQFQDWALVTAPRTEFVRDALLKGQLPLHMADSSALRNTTDRYLVFPDVFTAPQMILLLFLQMTSYILVNLWIMYTIGVVGLLLIKRKFSLSPVSFTLLFLFFNFNGQIQAHLSIGHYVWLGYFLFPYLFILVIRLLEAPQGWRWVAQVAFLLFFMELQGSYHQFIWSLMFLGLLGLAAWRRFWSVLEALIASGLLTAVRLLPPLLGLSGFDTQFLSGFPTFSDLVHAFIKLIDPVTAYAMHYSYHSLSWWEFDFYLGLAGTLLFLVFGGAAWIYNQLHDRQYPQLFLPVVVMTFLSMGAIYEPVMSIPFPLLTAERVSSRLITLPYVFVMVIAAINLQRWLSRLSHPWILQIITLPMLAALAYDLYRHFLLWNLASAAKAFQETPVNLAIKVVNNHPDPQYLTVVAIGAGISLVTGAILIYLGAREGRAVPSSNPAS